VPVGGIAVGFARLEVGEHRLREWIRAGLQHGLVCREVQRGISSRHPQEGIAE
jgi:hypothetical protein